MEELDLGGEVDSVNVVKTELCVKTVRANKEKIVGVNVRLDRNISNNIENKRFVLRQALVAALHLDSQSVGWASRTFRAGKSGRVSSRPGTGESSLMSATARAGRLLPRHRQHRPSLREC